MQERKMSVIWIKNSQFRRMLQQTGRHSRRCSEYKKVLGLFLFTLLGVLAVAGARAEEPSPPSSVSVWYAAGTSLVRVDAESGNAAGSVTLSSQTSPVSSLVSHPTDGSVSVLAKGHLLGFDTFGNKTFEEPVAAASSLGTAPVLASDPHDGSLWVGGSGLIVLADARGQNQRTVKLNTGEVVKAIFASQGGGAYALTQSRLLRLSKAGEVISTRTMPTGGVKSPTYLAVDENGSLGYVANATQVAQVSLDKPSDPPIRKIKPKGGIGVIAVNPFDGTFYVASRPSSTGNATLYSYDDGNGLLLKKVSVQASAIRTLSFDTPSQTLWLGTDSKVLAFQKDLSQKAQIAASGLNTLSGAPLSLSSRVSLLEPQDGATTTDPNQPIELNLKAFCNNESCPAGFGYPSKLALKASLNGQDVSNQFQITGDAGSASGAEATYTPASGLPEGTNRLVAEAVDPFGVLSNHLEATFTVDTTAPSFLEVKPEDGSVLTEQPATITGRVDDPNARVYLEGLEDLGGKVISDDPGGFSFEVPLKEGENSFRLLAYDQADNLGEYSLTLIYEAPLELTITEPEQGSTVNTDKITVKGTVKGPQGTTVHVGDVEASIDAEGNFVAENVQLVEGANSIVVEAIAPNGESVQATLEVVYEPATNPDDPPDTEPPVDPSDPTARSEQPPDSPLPAPGPLPPDPEQVAPPVEEGVSTGMADSTSFLYEGSNAVQTGMEPETIQDRRVAVLRGKVLNRLGEPVPGVRITVLDHPEYGQTLTREDGQFDIAVNGGGTMTLVYEKDRYMPAQRQVEAPWRDFATVEDVVLVGFSRRVTDVDLAGTDEMLVAEGSAITDEVGTRQSTLLLPGNTDAKMVMPDGTERPLPQMDLRATEYTVGETGPEAMPAPLPPTSGYTYAVELSVDEAVEAGAEEVRFTEPLYNYVENFLGFPVGTDVPSGYYDRENGKWIGSEDGRVIKIVGIQDGLAEIDVDGSGLPADATALQNLGVTDEERRKLAGLYQPGQSLWRVPVTHFSPHDYNWPYGPPPDAGPPGQPPPDDGTGAPAPDCVGGSVIECQNQVLREYLNVSGAPFRLHYGSDRVEGYKAARSLDIPLSVVSTPPGSLTRIDLEVEVAGQRFKTSFPPPREEKLRYTYTWNGKDAYGRAITGEQDVTYKVGYVYSFVYHKTLDDFNRAWDMLSGIPYTGGRCCSGDITLWQHGTGKVYSDGAADGSDQGVGGWTPDILHRYDPEGEMFLLGNGDRRGSESIPSTITTAAGNGEVGYSGDGGPAKDAKLQVPYDVAAGPDGSLYIADFWNFRVRKVSPDGTISTVAGGGQLRDGEGDGGPATDVALQPVAVDVGPDGSLYIVDHGGRLYKVSPDGTISTVLVFGINEDGSGIGGGTGLAVSPDGSLYVVENFAHQVHKVGTDGTISTVAGIEVPPAEHGGYSGDGGPAKDAELNFPSDVAVGPDGSLYIADEANSRVRKVGTDGIITTVAGGGNPSDGLGDGGPATDAQLYQPHGVAVGLDGRLFIADAGNNRVREVSSDGIMTTAAGVSTSGFSGDDGPATDAQLNSPQRVTVDPDGDLYIADTFNNRVRKVGSPLPGISAGDITVPSENGTQLYIFSKSGKHLRTLDAATGAVLYRFAYDEKGRLASIEDVDGLITRIERDASGNATAIVAPNGDRTELALGANGYLASVSNPAGESVQLDYREGGLLQSLTDPKSNTTRFDYDEMGRLTKDTDPAGGFKELLRTRDSEGAVTTRLTTASGRETTYEVRDLPGGGSLRLNTDASGLTTERLIGANGSEKVIAPDGTVVESSLDPDPRFGMQSPVVEKATVKTPGGLTKSTTASREATLATPGDPTSATSITQKFTSGDKVYTSTWDKPSKTIKNTSPEGRSSTTTVDEKGRPILEESSGFAPTSYEYDGRGRLTKITEGTGTEARTITYTYDAKDRVNSMTDPSSREWRFEYDAARRVVRQIGPNDQTISYAYDKNGNLTSITPSGQPTHEFAYDSRNLPTSYDAPQVGTEDRTTGYDYDLDRLPTSQALPGGGKIEYLYDAGGRLKTLRYPEGEKNYSYNPGTGNLATVSTANGTLSYAFDGFLPLSETSMGQIPGKVGLRYDSDLRLAGIRVNDGPEISYSYDKDNLVTKAGSLDVTRDAQRGLITGTMLSGVTDQSTYNAFGETESYEALSGSSQLYKTTYKRDSLGRIVEKTETVTGESTTYSYSYDEEGNLKEVKQDGSLVASYAYDENGNRLSRTTPSGITEGSYDVQDRLTSYGNNDYTYTPDGHLKSKTDRTTGETTSYAYDALGNLLSVELPDGKKVEYVVDAADRRVGKKVNGQLVQGFLYQGQLAPVAELDGAGNVVSRFAYGTKPNVPDYMEKSGKTYRIITDQVGSVRLVVDASTGEVAQRLDYDEFGNVLNDTNPGFQPFGFAGGLYDPATKFTRFGARDYDAEVGKWTAKDPILFAGGQANLYGYVLNDPVNLIDPTGLDWGDYWDVGGSDTIFGILGAGATASMEATIGGLTASAGSMPAGLVLGGAAGGATAWAAAGGVAGAGFAGYGLGKALLLAVPELGEWGDDLYDALHPEENEPAYDPLEPNGDGPDDGGSGDGGSGDGGPCP
jgi:RHS repeat-associated protein